MDVSRPVTDRRPCGQIVMAFVSPDISELPYRIFIVVGFILFLVKSNLRFTFLDMVRSNPSPSPFRSTRRSPPATPKRSRPVP